MNMERMTPGLNMLPFSHVALSAHEPITLADGQLDLVPFLTTPPNFASLPVVMKLACATSHPVPFELGRAYLCPSFGTLRGTVFACYRWIRHTTSPVNRFHGFMCVGHNSIAINKIVVIAITEHVCCVTKTVPLCTGCTAK